MKKILFATFAAALQISCALAGVPRAWDADVGSPAAFQTSAWQGETVELAAQLVRGRKPFAIPEGATAGLWWKTNGMDRYWGPAPATVSTNGVVEATWTPTNDVGAASYRGFLGVSLSGDGSNRTYAANFTLRMLESPGFAPNSLPLPVQSIDFSSVQVLNAPWIEEESDPTVPSWAKAETPPLTEESDPVWEAEKNGYATSDDVDAAYQDGTNYAAGAVAALKSQVTTGWWGDTGKCDPSERNGRPIVAAVALTDSLHNYEPEGIDLTGWWCVFYANDTTRDARESLVAPKYPADVTGETIVWSAVDAWGTSVTATRHRVAAPIPTTPEDIGAQPAGDYATPDDIADEISAASNALARAWSADSVLLSSMLLGSNVVAEVTNYNSQVRSPTLRLLQLNESNEYFQVWAETNNLSRVALAATNHADTVSAAAYDAATNYAAPRAWSGTTSGLGADAPEGWTWISTPQMAIAGGLEYEKNITSGGAIWILKSNGMAADFHSVSNNTAYLDISATDGSSLFRIEKTDSFLVGVDTTSVNVSGDALICGVNCVSATHPLVRVRQSLTQGDWSREEDGIPANLATVEWSGESGAWVCEITNTSGGHSMFATMEMLQEGGAKLVNAAALDVSSSGILCTDGVHKVRPVYNNGSVTWEVFQ